MTALAQIAPLNPIIIPRRIVEAELDGVLPWLTERLQADYPALSREGLWSTLHGAVHGRGSPQLLVQTPNVIGLFEARADILDHRPAVWEVWVRSREVAHEEASALYVFARRWAQSINAREFHYGHDTDAAMNHVTRALTDIRKGMTEPKKRSVFVAHD